MSLFSRPSLPPSSRSEWVSVSSRCQKRSKKRLKAYPWPGNVRELQNVIERAVITSRDGSINLDRALPDTSHGGPLWKWRRPWKVCQPRREFCRFASFSNWSERTSCALSNHRAGVSPVRTAPLPCSASIRPLSIPASALSEYNARDKCLVFSLAQRTRRVPRRSISEPDFSPVFQLTADFVPPVRRNEIAGVRSHKQHREIS